MIAFAASVALGLGNGLGTARVRAKAAFTCPLINRDRVQTQQHFEELLRMRLGTNSRIQIEIALVETVDERRGVSASSVLYLK